MNTLAIKPSKPVKQVKFRIVETAAGQWRILDGPKKGYRFREYSSDLKIFGRPLVSIAAGMDPRTEAMAVADGIIAIGQKAKGFIAIGQFCNGGVLSIGQFATSRCFALGQFTVAPLAIGQFSCGVFVMAQMGIAGAGLFQIGISLFPILSRIFG